MLLLLHTTSENLRVMRSEFGMDEWHQDSTGNYPHSDASESVTAGWVRA